jgi:tetratricopeptide (TPR) repeat protein
MFDQFGDHRKPFRPSLIKRRVIMWNIIRISAVLATCVLLVMGIGCTKKVDDGKIPITTSSNEARELYLQARQLQDGFLFRESREILQQALAKDPDFALAYRDLAFAQPSNKAFFEYFDKARALVDKVSEGERLWILGNEAGVNGDPVKQGKYFLQLVEGYPKDERAHFVLGVYYFGQQEYGKAVAEFHKSTEIAPDFAPPYNMLGYANRAIENYDEAEKAFKKYTELNPDDPNPYDSYAELLLKMGRFEESIQSYKKALAVKPDFVPSYVGIAADLVYQGKYEEARGQMHKLLELAKDNGQRRTAYFNIAMSYIDEGKYDQALAAIENQYALAESIHDTGAMAGDIGIMAAILFAQSQYDSALEKYKTSLKLTMNSGLSDEIKGNAQRNFLYNEGRVALKKGDLITAKARSSLYGTQVGETGNVAQIRLAHELAGMIALEEKDYAKAVEEFLQGNQQNPYNLYRLAMAYKGQGNQQKAEEYCIKAARFHSLLNLNYAFARRKAEKTLSDWAQK